MNSHLINPLMFLNNFAKARNIPLELAEKLKYEIDKHVYYYGNHFRAPYERSYDQKQKESLFQETMDQFDQIIKLIDGLPNWQNEIHNYPDQRSVIVCNAYFLWGHWLESLGFLVVPPPWENTRFFNPAQNALAAACQALKNLFPLGIDIITHPRFVDALITVELLLESYFNHPKIVGLILPYALPFFECTSTGIFSRLNKPSFIAIHGLPGQYDTQRIDFPVNYYLVWGQAIRDNMLAYGMHPESIIVTGHPNYHNYTISETRYSLEKVLVLTYPMSGAPCRNMPYKANRFCLIDFVSRIQLTLVELGVKRARLRCNPSENPEWYEQFIDTSFWEIDRSDLAQSLNQSSLVIGGVSTVFLESLLHGVEYVIFTPDHEYDYVNLDLVAPYNGTDRLVPVTRTDAELCNHIKTRRRVNLSILDRYIQRQFTPEIILSTLSKPD